MKTTKKVLGVLVALAMLVNVFAMFSFAAVPDTAIDLTLTVDKANYSAGEVVTITVSEKADAAVVGNMRIGGGYAIGYNTAVIGPLSDGLDPAANQGLVAIQSGYDNSISTMNFSSGYAMDAGYGWDDVELFCLADDMMTEFDATEGVDLFTFQMKLADDVADGDYVIGFNKESYINYDGYSNDAAMGGVYGYDDDYGYGTTANYGLGTVTIHVGAPAGSPVEFQKAQIRFKGITGPTSTSADYQGTFDVRTVAQITEANFAATFTDETTAKAGISTLGFVYATKSNVATFDVDTAKAVAEGGSAANYVNVPVTYMQHTGGNYIFTCLISGIADADKTDGVNCLGYVCFNGTYYYFDAAASVDFGTLYTAYMPA